MFKNYRYLHLRIIIPALLFLLPASDVFHNFIGIQPGNITTLVCLILASLFFQPRLLQSDIIFFCVLVSMSFLQAYYFDNLKYMTLHIYFYFGFLVVRTIRTADIIDIVELLSSIVIVFICLGFVGFIYAKLGGTALYCFPNEDSRLNCLYLTTFTNSWRGVYIRPAAIFDEPGALGFIAGMILFMRCRLKLSSGKNYFLAVATLITFSLAHAIVLILYLLGNITDVFRIIRKIRPLTILLIAGITGICFFVLYDKVQDLIINRLIDLVISENFAGNRTIRMLSAIKAINLSSIFWGVGPNCVLTNATCGPNDAGYFIGANPIGYLAKFGLIASFPYYFLLLKVIFRCLKSRMLWVGLAYAALLMQRPELFNYAYAFMILFSTDVILRAKEIRIIHQNTIFNV
jgi:hypothetical protein